MRAALASLLVLAAAASNTGYLQFERPVTVPDAARTGEQVCAVLDPAIYAHANASLGDLRLYTAEGSAEIPYVLTLSETSGVENEPARVLNLGRVGGRQGGGLAFDLQMPQRAYTDVTLDLNATDFLATATVTGVSNATRTELGTFTLFDLSAQHLSRSTTLHLQESNFPVLHVVITPLPGSGPLAPESLTGASAPPSREAQTLYTTALVTSVTTQKDHETLAHFTIPARLPLERVRVALAPGFSRNFSRDVRITSRAAGQPAGSGEQLTGTIERIHLTRGGAAINDERLTVPATLGSNLQGKAEVEVAIENGDDPPLPVQTVALETRERRLCFEAPETRSLTLFYGDEALEPARYDYARTFRAEAMPKQAALGAEQRNPGFQKRPDEWTITEKHPRLIYLGLILVVCLLGVVALRSAKLRV